MDELVETIKLTETTMKYAMKKGYIPGEDLKELIDSLMSSRLNGLYHDHLLEEALNRLIKDGELRISIRKGQFLHLRPTLI